MRLFTKTLTILASLCLLFVVASNAQQNGSLKVRTDLTTNSHLYLYKAMLLSASEMPSGQDDEEGILSNRNIKIINLGPIVNYEGLDYAPTISADGRTLFYVSDRPGSKVDEYGDDTHDFWAVRKANRLDTVFNAPYNIDTTTTYGKQGVNTILNEGAASIAADRQSLYFTGCNRPDGMGDCDLYRTTIEGDQWGRPVNLGRNVNSKLFDSQPSIAPDQSRIYFVSTRLGPNSDGDNKPKEMDIWYCDWDYDIEEWGPAKNLEAINTKGKDVSPFIAADNATLFFASDGHEPNFGGLDFYVTRYDPVSDSWSKPQNLGKPINTEGNEQFITLPASGDIIYFSSTRQDLKGYQGSLDIFMAFVPTFFRAVNLRVSVIDECSGENIPAMITIKNPLTNREEDFAVTLDNTMMEMVVSNTDYGDPRDSLDFVNLEIKATNEKYGEITKIQRVDRPQVTQKADEAGSIADEINVVLTMGQRPILGATMEEADYIKRSKEKQPKLSGFRGLVMEEVKTWDLYPLLNYVFFDLGSSEIPDRYILFKNAAQTKMFSDTSIAGGTLDKYYHLLNIYGFRLQKYPDAKIEIVGCNDSKSPEEKKAGLSKDRAQVVYDYFKYIWQIDESRMKLSHRNAPQVVSNLKDSLGIKENRRVEILCKEWEIMKPVFDKDPKTFPQPEQMTFTMKNGIEDELVTKRRIEIKRDNSEWMTLNNVGIIDPSYIYNWTSDQGKYPKNEAAYIAKLVVTTGSGAECESDPITIPVMQVSTEEKRVDMDGDSTQERYNLILFPFDRSDAGPINLRIMRDYVYDRVLPESKIEVIGHTDVVGLYDHNQKLSERRANAVYNELNKATKGKYNSLVKRGVGEDEALYTNDLPEGRFYNRTVQVLIRTPISAWEE